MGVPSLICTYLYGSFMLIKNTLEGYLQVAKNMLKRVDALAMALMNTCRIMMDTTMTVMIKMVKQYEKELMDMIYNSIFGTDRSFWCNKLWNCLALLAELLDSNSWLCSKLKSYLERKCRSTQVFNTMDAIAEAANDFLKFQQIVCDAGFTAEFGISYIKQLFAWIKGIVEEYLQFIERQWKRLRLLAESYLNLVIDWGIIDWLEKLISFFMCAFDDSASCAELATAKNFYDDYLSKLKLEKNGEGYDLSREYKNSIYGTLEGAKQMAKNLKHEVDEAYDKWQTLHFFFSRPLHTVACLIFLKDHCSSLLSSAPFCLSWRLKLDFFTWHSTCSIFLVCLLPLLLPPPVTLGFSGGAVAIA